ncbi:ribosome maturation factor RimP [Dietzia sp. B32]|uniref:ribosome maturation factor RimP n=1 Tax=Dietzia sp. B32 TaxID=2915130 RepID=UPI0021AD8F2E|nr:ribosome maturation protein RimP [Dietzia sp. B32]UVE95619.1 ribosome maturation protein RimP [Dietzia sp. B32]
MIVPEPDRAHIRKAVSDRGLDLEDIRENTRSSTWQVTVVVDGDSGVSLDDLAELSVDLDPLAEQWGGSVQPVTLEVTSRGVDAPLEQPRHWRRARGRQVDLVYVDGAEGPSRGRVGDLDEATGVVRIVSRAGRGTTVESVALEQVARAVIRVEFRPAPQEELDLLSEPENPGRGVREGENR